MVWPAPAGLPNIWQSVNDGIQNMLFQNTLMDTGDTARALQAFYTSIARTAYYSMSYRFDIQDQYQISGYKSYQFPRSTGGLLSVGIILVIHCMLVGILALMFLSRTQLSRIGDNSWQSVAQVTFSSDEMQDILKLSNNMKDDEVKKAIQDAGLTENVTQLASLQRPNDPEELPVSTYGLVCRKGLPAKGRKVK